MNAKPNKANNEFLFNALNSMQQEIVLSGKDGSTFAAINKDQVYKLLLPQAPIKLQNEFSDFVHHIDKLKFSSKKNEKRAHYSSASRLSWARFRYSSLSLVSCFTI